jgi:hypothetical protein
MSFRGSAGFLSAVGISICFWTVVAFRGLFEAFEAFAGSARPAPAQRQHQVDELPPAGRSLFVLGWLINKEDGLRRSNKLRPVSRLHSQIVVPHLDSRSRYGTQLIKFLQSFSRCLSM